MPKDWTLACVLYPKRGLKWLGWGGTAQVEASPCLTACSLLVCAVGTDCRVEAHPCEHRTLETIRELAGTAPCWRGALRADAVLATRCPFYRFVYGHTYGLGGVGQALPSCRESGTLLAWTRLLSLQQGFKET